MIIPPEQIDTWLGVPKETAHLEFKEAKVSFDRTRLAKYCVALANEGGGHLVLGISDKAPRSIVGSEAFPNIQETEYDLSKQLGFRVDVVATVHAGRRIVVFRAPPGPRERHMPSMEPIGCDPVKASCR